MDLEQKVIFHGASSGYDLLHIHRSPIVIGHKYLVMCDIECTRFNQEAMSVPRHYFGSEFVDWIVCLYTDQSVMSLLLGKDK